MSVVLDVRVVAGSGGGPDKTILSSPRFLAKDGYQMLCAYLRDPDDLGFARLRDRARVCGAPLVEVDDHGPSDWRVARRLLEVCRRERVAIWHGHDYKSNVLGLLLRPFWPMRLVTTVHGWVHQTRRTPLYYAIDRLCLPRYERVLCVSEDLRERCLVTGVHPERCRLLENGIDTSRFARRIDRAEAKQRLGLPPDRFVVGAVGRLSAEKGFDGLIRAIDRLLRVGHDLELLIVGEGDERPHLEGLIAELDRGDRVRLLGYRDDVLPVFEAMDAFALSSLREGLPNVVLEAMALGVPVVATRIAGVPRLIRDCDNGLLVDVGSVDDLAGALGRLLVEPGLGDRLRLAGRATIETGYSFAVRMGRLRDLYDDLLGQTAPMASASQGTTP